MTDTDFDGPGKSEYAYTTLKVPDSGEIITETSGANSRENRMLILQGSELIIPSNLAWRCAVYLEAKWKAT